MPDIDLQAIRGRISLAQRLARLHLEICPEPPAGILAEDEGPHDDLIRWSRETGLGLDWIFVGDTDPLIISAMCARRPAA